MLGKRLVASAALAGVSLGIAGSVGMASAGAAGGVGASLCSNAGDPATTINPGTGPNGINSQLPFGGNGNDGSNPGFNFGGMSFVCKVG